MLRNAKGSVEEKYKVIPILRQHDKWDSYNFCSNKGRHSTGGMKNFVSTRTSQVESAGAEKLLP